MHKHYYKRPFLSHGRRKENKTDMKFKNVRDNFYKKIENFENCVVQS
jgi:hypothetical protein